jgi:anthranilate/para-aminobenzoate synthase component I
MGGPLYGSAVEKGTASAATRRTGPGGAARWRFRPRVWRLERAVRPVDALRVLGPERRPVLLDGAGGAPRRFTLVGFDPLPAPLPEGVLGLRSLVTSLVHVGGDEPTRWFAGGFLGALAYDLGVAGEDLALPPEPWGQPRIVGGLYTDHLVHDEERDETWLVLADEPGDDRPPVGERRDALLAALDGADEPAPLVARGPLRRDTPSAEHVARVEAVRRAIEEGEVYQANLAHRFGAEVEGDPRALYARLREANPAPYMGAVLWPGGALLSSSPELLLEVEGSAARTRPIKGTIARGTDAASDAAAREALLASAKDRAELTMIVDLERNDLGRIARTGSVRVEGLPTLETYARVHHLVADVRAELAPGRDAVDALAALFPGGSITGAPKLRSMELIAELEGEGRGFFCGSLGLLDVSGRALFNILIRSVLWREAPARGAGAGEVSWRVGGGITHASVAEDEDAETLAKGAALAAALGTSIEGDAS